MNEFTTNYNNTKHSSILIKPSQVNELNKHQVWVTLFGDTLAKFPLPKFRVGVSKYKRIFSKGYEANFTEEIFKISKVHRGDPNMYEIEDHEGESIIGKFYEEKLSAIDKKKDDVYRVEKILRRRKGRALVTWLGYDSKHNSWVPEKDIKKTATK